MGTRSTTTILVGDRKSKALCTMYRHMDGYVSGHGAALIDFLSGMTVVNGISMDTPKKAANGMKCLAAQIVAHFKDGIGGIYMECPSKMRTEEYFYLVYLQGTRIHIRISGYDGTIYEGAVDDIDMSKIEGE